MIKKIFSGVFALLILFSLAGCQANNATSKEVDGKLENLMTKLYDEIGDDEKPMGLENMEVNSDNITSFIGTDKVKYDEIVVSESMVGSIAHSVILLRASKDQDVEEAKKLIKDNIDPRKWICVGVEKDDVIIKNRGNLILVVVVEDEAIREKISNSFDNL